MRINSVGHAVFALTLIAIGIVGLVWGGFTAALPKYIPAHEAVAYLRAFITLVCGLGLVWRRTATIAARVLLVYLLLWMVLLNGSIIMLAPLVEVSYQNWGETAVIVAAAWVLYAWFAADWDRQHLGFAVGDSGLHIARVIYACAMFAFGLSHFFYLSFTASLVPAWLPWHVGWAYFFGCTYIAAGLGMLIGVYARLAAVLSTVQMGLFTLLVWVVPIVVTGHVAAGSSWGEFADSWAMTAGAWVVADSYRGIPWRSIGKSSRVV